MYAYLTMCVARPNDKISDAPENNRQTENKTEQKIKTTQRNFRYPLSELTNFILTMELGVQINQFPKIRKRKRKEKYQENKKGFSVSFGKIDKFFQGNAADWSRIINSVLLLH